MVSDELDSLFNGDNELVLLFSKNPFFIRRNDEIGETTLVKWTIEEYFKTFDKKINKNEVLGFLFKMENANLIIRKRYGRKVLVLPTRNFFLVKQGKPPVKIKSKNPTGNDNDKVPILYPPMENEKEPPQLMDTHYPYREFLIGRITSKSDKEQKIIKDFPNLYSLACNILNDVDTDWHTKIMISAALGYYILEEDIYPDSAEQGYVDDLFILCYVLREIKKHVSSNIITSNWNYGGDIMELIELTYEQTYTLLGDKACDVLHKVGLWKFKKLELVDYYGSLNEKIQKLLKEKRELLGLVAYLVKVIYHADVSTKDLDYIKEYLKTFGDFDEINRIIMIAYQGYDLPDDDNKPPDSNELDDRLRKSLLKTLMED